MLNNHDTSISKKLFWIIIDELPIDEDIWLVFQDLLQMQYDGASIMNISGFAKINVNLLIFLLNKKFYGK